MGLGERVAELEEIVERFQGTVAHLRDELRQRDERIRALEAALEAAQRAGKRQAAPFSKNGPKEGPGKPGRKTGGAHGRHGHRMAPTSPPDLELDADLPPCCPFCGGDIEHERDAEQWQVDVGEMRPVTTRFRVRVGRCRKCRRRVQGHHHDQASGALGAAASQVGPAAKAWASFLHYSLGLSWVKVQALMARLGIVTTAGALCQAAERSASTDLVPVHQELVRRANSSPVVVMDETGWRVGGKPAWLWEATNTEVTVYWVANGRGFEQACEVIGADYDGTIVRDGWAPYRRYQKATHQTCIAHLLRRATHLEEDLPKWATPMPKRAKAILKEALAARELSPGQRRVAAVELAERLDELCQGRSSHPAVRRYIAHLAKEAPAMFSFLSDDRVDATNWRAEQGIRPAVVNRKVWGGNRTERGGRAQGTIMSIVRTASQHGVDAIDYLTSLARGPDPGLVLLLG